MKKLHLLCLLIFIIPLLLPSPVYAATLNRNVAGEGSLSFGGGFFTYFGGAADYTVLNSDDTDTSYWEGTTAGGASKYHTYDMQNWAAAGGITNVRLTIKARRVGGVADNNAQMTPVALISGSGYGSTLNSLPTSYVSYYVDWPLNPATGTNWTTATLNAAEFGINGLTGAGVTIRNTYMFLTVTYSPPELPTMDTTAATTITDTSATLNGEVTADGYDTIDTRGFVWDTVSRGDPGNVAPGASAYANNWTEGGGVGDFGENPFSHDTGAVLVKNTIYYYRSAGNNSVGWAYGDEVVFTTLNDPTVSTSAASQVEATTARLNALIVDDGDEACTVAFAWGATAGGPYANFAAFPSNDTVAGTWATGTLPFLDITGLTVATDYTFLVSATNQVSTQYGSQLTFETESGIEEPTDLKAYVNDANSISLEWTKGTGSTNTLVRWKLNTYPQTTVDGTLLYFDIASSVEHTGLAPGTTYYYSAWGESGGTFSTDNTTVFATTVAYTTTTPDMAAPDTPTEWFQSPDYTKLANFPGYGYVNWIADAWDMPRNSAWSFMSIGFVVLAGIVLYRVSNKLPVALLVVGVGMVTISLMGLTSLWMIFPAAVIMASAWAVGERA